MTKLGHMIITGNLETVNAHTAYLFHFYRGTFNILEIKEGLRSNQNVTDFTKPESILLQVFYTNGNKCLALKRGMGIIYVGSK